MTDFFSNFDGFVSGGVSAEQYFYRQVFEAFKTNVENGTLPFFNKDLNKIPRELSTGKVINNENAIVMEQIASKNGYKSNLWIYGSELNKIQKEVGDLYYKKGAEPALCLTKYFGSTHLDEKDLYIAEGGSGRKEQYLYNIDSLTDKSREKLLKYYEQANAVDKKYTSENLKGFEQNIKQNKMSLSDSFTSTKEKVIAASKQDGINLIAITNCHYLHNLSNSIGKPEMTEAKIQNQKALCYETAQKFIEKTSQDRLPSYKSGLMLCTALNAGTEFQRISVAKDYNLENAKRVEELKAAEANIKQPYHKRGGLSY